VKANLRRRIFATGYYMHTKACLNKRHNLFLDPDVGRKRATCYVKHPRVSHLKILLILWSSQQLIFFSQFDILLMVPEVSLFPSFRLNWKYAIQFLEG